MRSGPKAILYQSNLYRTSELVWVKVAPLQPWRNWIRWSLVAAGLAFFYIVASAKGSWWNLEGLLGLLVWHVGYQLSPEVRLASSGDLQESYESRGGSGSAPTFSQWIGALGESEQELKLKGPHYQHWFNLDRVAWAGPCWMADLYPLVLVPVFVAYHFVIDYGIEFPSQLTLLSDIHFLTFENSTAFVHFLCWLISFLGIAAFLTSFSPGLRVRACGGLEDRFALSNADREGFFEALAGLASKSMPNIIPKVEVPVKPEPAVEVSVL
jgi:hypothetical protein